MRLRSCETYWLLKNGLLQSYPSLRSNVTCDIVVVGGGITGCLAAYQCAADGYKTILIDRRDVSLGSTCASTALLQYEIDEPLFTLKEKVGEQVAIDCYREGVDAIGHLGRLINDLKIDCDFEYKTSLFFAHDDDSKERLLKEFDARNDAGISVKWISSSQLLKDYGLHAFGGILSEAAASTDCYRLAHGLLSYAERHHHLSIFDHTGVASIERDAYHNYIYTDDSYTLTCKKVIYATGFETQKILTDKIVNLISTYACVSEPLSNIPQSLKDTLFWDTEDPYLYFRSTQDNRILVGGADEQFVNPEKRDDRIDEKESVLADKLHKIIPGIKIIPDFTWAGTFGVTKDALPYIGSHPDYPNSYFVLGFGGNGITFSVMGMRIISDALAGRENKLINHFRFGR